MKLLSWAGVVLGIWILLTPWACGLNNITWISVVCGAVIALLSLISALRQE